MNTFHEEEALGKVYDGRLMRRLLAYAVPHWHKLLLSILMLGVVVGVDLARPYVIQVVIDEHLSRPFAAADRAAVVRWAAIYFGMILVAFVVHYSQRLILQATGQSIIFDIRQDIFGHLQEQSLTYFDSNPVGRLVTRVTNDTETLNQMYTDVVVNLFRDVFTLVGVVLVMFRYSTFLALVSLATLPVVVVTTRYYRDWAREAYRDVRVKLARINATLNENISGMRLVQIFNREQEQREEFAEINEDHLAATLRQIRVYAIFRPSLDLLRSLALALLLWLGGARVIGATLEVGVLVAFIEYIRMLYQPINQLAEKFNILQAAMASSERIFQIMDREPDIQDPEEPLPLPEVKGRVAFEDVWFAYEEDDWVLRDINVTIEPGETVALVGHTGAGKSSLINLIARFYDVQHGRVTVDGVDVRRVRKAELRRRIGVVLQDVFLFTGDIASNIRLNDESISDRDLRQVASYVNADQFVDRLPDGYDHPVTERGSTLSAGQRQLLAFARALAFDAPILVLDEATANIDTETEELIQEALQRLSRDRTTIVIAHRLSTIQRADKILVMHKGRIVERGDHEELLGRGGLYYDLYRLQYKDQALPAGD